MTESLSTRGASKGAPLISIQRVLPEVAIYQTLHGCDTSYQTRNQGLACRNKWLGMVAQCESVLEVGCGNGLLCEFLAHAGKKVTGVDLVQGPYDRRSKGYAFMTRHLVKERLPNEYDVTLCFDVLEHIPEEDIDTVLENIGQSARSFVLSIAGYGHAPIHPTVKTPGWWLNKLFNHMPGRSWLCEVFERYEDRESPVYLFMGNYPNEDRNSHTH